MSRWWLQPWNQKTIASWQESQDKPVLKSKDVTLPTEMHIVKAVVFPEVTYGCESWTVRKAESQRIDAFKLVVLEKTPECPLDSTEIKPVNPKGNHLWILIGRTDAEAEAPVFWSPDAKTRLSGKVCDAGKDWGQKEKRVSEDKIARWCHQCNGHELGQIQGDGEGQGGLVCCSPWGLKESDMTGWLNNNNRDFS